jgi:outer membrane protein assembly factor BamC
MPSLRLPLFLAAVAALSGCGFFGGDEAPRTGSAEALKLPPDLELERSERALTVPGDRDTTATASGGGQVLPESQNFRVKRAGTDRWLQVAAPPSEVWTWLPRFLEAKGIEVERKRPGAGIVETEWVYTRKPLTRGAFAPQVGSRKDATAADRYLLRVEPGPSAGTTEVFVAHRRAARQGPESWRLLPRDPFMEAEVLRGLAVFMGAEIEKSVERIAKAEQADTGAELISTDTGETRVLVPGDFFDSWRRVGLALDRAAFTVVERNRDQRYVDVRFDTKEGADEDEEGFFDSLAFWRSEGIPETIRRLRLVFRESKDGNATEVALESPDDEAVSPERREEILAVLAEEIR